MTRNRCILSLLAAAALQGVVGPALAQGFPSRPSKVITPFPASQGHDAQAPEILEKLATFTYEALPMSPGDMSKLMEQAVANWGPVIQTPGVKLD